MQPEVKLFICVTCLVTMVHLTSSEIFTSSMKVERMVMEEEQLLHELKGYAESKLPYDRRKIFQDFYSNRLRDARNRSRPELRENLKHPNAVYHVIKGFVLDYQNALGEYFDEFQQMLKNSSGQFLEDRNDIKGARSSLLRLQRVYKLTTRNMINGDYFGFMGPSLGLMDAFEIGQTAFLEGTLNRSLEWLNASLQIPYSNNQFMVRPSPGAVKALMGRAHLFNGDVNEAEKLYHEARILEPQNGDVYALGRELHHQPRLNLPSEVDSFRNFSRLCRLDNTIYPAEPTNPRIVCRYRVALLPYYRFKEELLSISPFASVFHDFVSDSESEHLKSFVQNKLERGKIGGESPVTSAIRTSDLAKIWDYESDLAKSISLKIQHLTGLDTSQSLKDRLYSGEAFQVVNYGLAGHYDVHMDIFNDTIKQASGDRIATFLIYFSDVQRGGSTVFTRAEVSVAPKKVFWDGLNHNKPGFAAKYAPPLLHSTRNMALFWYNYDRALRVDDLTQHAGCPVVIGHKWISNKWIWSSGNTFRRRCGLTLNATQLDIDKDMRRGYK